MMRTAVLDTHTEKGVLWWLLPLLFLPKVNLITFGGGETAGVRIDDILLFGFSFFFLFAALSLRKTLIPLEKLMIAITGLSLVSFAFNRFLFALGEIDVNSSIFYALRPLEYFLFFYVGQMAYGRLALNFLIALFLSWNALIMGLQWLGAIPAVSVDGFMYVSGRIPGIASFPSEMGALLNLCFCALLFSTHKLNEWIPYFLFITIGALVMMTASRASMAAHVIVFMFYLKTSSGNRQGARLVLGSLFLLIAFGIFLTILPHIEEIYDRSLGLLSWSNLDLIKDVWHHIEPSHNPLGNESVEYDDGYDMSWWIRIHKWCYALKVYTLHPECYLQGIGPGFASAGLDGGILRIFVELGIVGAVLYAFFFRKLMQLSPYIKWMVLVLLMNMTFFDAHLAYKPMSLLFLAAGYASMQNYWKES